MPFAYPTLMDAAPAISTVVDILKSNELATRAKDFAQAAWTVQGVVQAEIFGRSNVFGAADGEIAALPDADAVATLEAAGKDIEGMPTIVLIALAKFLLKKLFS